MQDIKQFFNICRNILFFTTLLFCFQGCIDAVTKATKKGIAKQQRGEYNYSIEYFKLALQKGGPKARLNYLIAENYRLTNRISEASNHYRAALDAGIKEDKAIFYFAQALKSQGRYTEAKVYFDRYSANGLNKNLVKIAKAESEFLGKIDELRNRESFYQAKNMGGEINTDGPEYAPIYRDGQLIYTASNNQFEYTAIGSGFTDIYSFKFDGIDENSGVKKEFGEKINQNKTHEACATISSDGGTVIFVRSNDGKRKGSTDTDLYITELHDEEWSTPTILKNVSDPRAWESSPALSPDGKTLYFASNKKGGYGGVDLYQATYSDSAGWGNVKNLGPSINTAGNDMFPYVRKDNRLFFSSDGHPGLGSLDIFAVITDSTGAFDRVENLGSGINSSADDFGITFKDKSNGYFSSNRKGGKGDDDIYEFRIVVPPPPPIVKQIKSYLTVFVYEVQPGKEKEIAIDSADVIFKADSNVVLMTGKTDSAGYYVTQVDSLIDYIIEAEKGGYFGSNTAFNVLKAEFNADFKSDSISPTLINHYYKTKLMLQKVQIGKEIVLEHIYYDYNKADIRPESEPGIMIFVDFLQKNTNVFVELGAHTDARGSEAYNLKLSQARAQSVVDFIVKHGIDPTRIKPVGYGKSKPIITNAVTEEEHQINRRTEFHIIDIKN